MVGIRVVVENRTYLTTVGDKIIYDHYWKKYGKSEQTQIMTSDSMTGPFDSKSTTTPAPTPLAPPKSLWL